MKTFIVNAARGVTAQKRKYDVTLMLMRREWRMMTDEPGITGKYIFLKDGKLLLSVNGLSNYSTWQMANESSLIMDEGVATFLYKVVHIDDNVVVLNLDGTENFCFLINDSSESLAKATFDDIQWYLYRNCNIDILTPELKKQRKRISKESCINQSPNDEIEDSKLLAIFIITLLFLIFAFMMYMAYIY